MYNFDFWIRLWALVYKYPASTIWYTFNTTVMTTYPNIVLVNDPSTSIASSSPALTSNITLVVDVQRVKILQLPRKNLNK